VLSKVSTKYCTVKGVTWGAQNFLGAESLCEVPKNPNNVTSTFFNAINLVPKDLRFKHGAPNLLLRPGPSNLVTPLCTLRMRNKYRYRLDMNKTGGTPPKLTNLQPACLKKLRYKAKGRVRGCLNKLFWK